MQDSRNTNNNFNRSGDQQQDNNSKHNNQQNASARDLGGDESLQKESGKEDRLTTNEPDNYERDSE